MKHVELLNLMRYWLVGTFAVVFISTTAYIGLFTRPDWITAVRVGLPVWGITAVLCIAWYYVYKLYISRKN